MSKIKNLRNFKLIVITVIILLIYLCLNTFAYLYSPFADWYTYHVFHHIQNIFSRILSPFSFTVGHILLYVYAYGFPILLLILILIRCFIKKMRTILDNFIVKFICYNLIVVPGLFLFNWIIPYHSSNLSLLHFDTYNKKYLVDDLYDLGKKYLNEMKRIDPLIKRDKNGNITTLDNLEELSVKALKSISDKYPLLKGYYPYAKKLCNYFLDASGMYFPLTIETAYCPYYFLFTPTLISHEYAHLKGFMKEDEATFISIMAGINSDNNLFKYSAYSEAYDYISLALERLDRDKYELLDQEWAKYYFISPNISYNDVSKYKYLQLELNSLRTDTYEDYSSFINFINSIHELISNDESVNAKYMIEDNNGKHYFYNDINVNLIKQNDKKHLTTFLFIDLTTINKNKYNQIYEIILNNRDNLYDILDRPAGEKYKYNFKTFSNNYINSLKPILEDQDNQISNKKERKKYYNRYMKPNIQDNFLFSYSDEYDMVVRLLLEYNDKNNY